MAYRHAKQRQLHPANGAPGQSAASAALEIDFAQLSDCGRVRGHNEDYLGHVVPATPAQARTHGYLFVLADGVGGQERGEVASRTAVEHVTTGFARGVPGEPHLALLTRLLELANTHVYDTGRGQAGSGVAMATTLVACALRFDRATLAHVGDSRCYLLRRGQANLLTRDHTVASEQVRLGLLSAEEAAQVPTRHVLSRSLGNDLFVNVETSEIQVLAGDVLLLCSDGLHGAVSGPEIAELLVHHSELNAAAQELISVANHRDGSDNISVQLIRIRSVERVGMYRGRPYRLH
jgi:protein phosphatase